MWDNLIRIVIFNLGFIALFAVLIYFPLLFKTVPVLFFVALFFGLSLLFVYTGAVNGMIKAIADYETPEFHDFVTHLKTSYLTSLIFAAINLGFIFLLSVAFPVYAQVKSILGPLASSLLFWVTIFWGLAIQYFYPILSRLDRKILKILKKMFLLLLDNPLFSIGLLIGTALVFVLSAFTAFLLPGLTTILLWHNVGLKLRLYKYDYLEEHPENRRSIPWDALLTEDRDRVGKRTLKGMIFPWKE